MNTSRATHTGQGRDNISAGPLQDIRVLDLSWLLPGPFATGILADLGAEVIKIERPGSGDYLRELSPSLFEKVNVGKRSVALDLKSDAGLANFYRLVATADVVVEGYRPGVARRLRIDPITLSMFKKDLIYVSVTGYGQEGPLALHSGHDINYLAVAGALSIPGSWNEEPRRSGLPVADLAASLYGVINIMAALRQRDNHGVGTTIDLSIADAVLHWSNTRFSDFDPAADNDAWSHVKPGNDVFTTADGRGVALGIIEEKFWRNFCNAAGRPDLEAIFMARGFAAKLTLRGTITSLVSGQDLAFWEKTLGEADVPFSVVNGPAESLAEPQFTQRGMVARVAGMHGQSIPVIALPGRAFGVTLCDPGGVTHAPALGADTDVVLSSIALDSAP